MDTERETLHISDDKQRIATIDGNLVRYQLSDHLGSASVELDQYADIISYEEYYPFGSTSYRNGRNEVDVSLKRYKYVMKELDNETGLYYYGMRYYASWICRFVSVDPLQHEYPYYTPFQYAGNKPISFIDLDGAEEDLPESAKNSQKSSNSENKGGAEPSPTNFKYYVVDLGQDMYGGKDWGKHLANDNSQITNIKVPYNAGSKALDYIIKELEKPNDGIAMLMIIGAHGYPDARRYEITGDVSQEPHRYTNDNTIDGNKLKKALTNLNFIDNSVIFFSSCNTATNNRYYRDKEEYNFIDFLSSDNKFYTIGANAQSKGNVGEDGYFWNTNTDNEYLISREGEEVGSFGSIITSDEIFEMAQTNAAHTKKRINDSNQDITPIKPRIIKLSSLNNTINRSVLEKLRANSYNRRTSLNNKKGFLNFINNIFK